MEIRDLKYHPDELAMISAQSRKINSTRVRTISFLNLKGDYNMDVKAAALAKAKALREGNKANSPSKKTAPKKAAAKKSAPRKTKHGDVPYARIAQMYDSGKSAAEISDALGYTEKGDWPYQYTYGILKRLRVGVNVNGKSIKVKPKQGKK